MYGLLGLLNAERAKKEIFGQTFFFGIFEGNPN